MFVALRCQHIRRQSRIHATGYRSQPHRRPASSRPTAGDAAVPHPTATYLHVGPSGDCWTGPPLFAAKHLQPDYVRSLPLPAALPAERVERLLEGDPALARRVYESMDLAEVLRLLDE